jgi:hypothetical protein
MKDYDPDYQAAVAQRASVERRLVRLHVKDRDTGAQTSFSFWNGPGRLVLSYKDALTGAINSNQFRPGLVSVGPIRLTADLSIQSLEVQLNGLDSQVANAIRGFTPRQASIQAYSLVLDPATREPVAPAEPIFAGVIDKTPIPTAAEGQAEAISLTCLPILFELTKTNPETRSNASQKRRSPTDGFYKFVQKVGGWNHKWGKKVGGPPSDDDGRKGGRGGGGSFGGFMS